MFSQVNDSVEMHELYLKRELQRLFLKQIKVYETGFSKLISGMNTENDYSEPMKRELSCISLGTQIVLLRMRT